jgi:caa(3)-type oxidase subunit IV
MAHASRKQYLAVFVALVILTVAEVGVVYVPSIGRTLLIVALVTMAIAKAGLVLMSYMHLSSETRTVKLGVIVPFLLPAIYAGALMAEATWRTTGATP